MTVAPLIAMKSTKCESLEAVGKELDRRAHTYANDVDQSGRHVGYLCRAGDESPVPLEQAIERRIERVNEVQKAAGKRAIDAARAEILAQVSTKVDSGIVCEGLSATPSQGGAEPRTLNQRGSLLLPFCSKKPGGAAADMTLTKTVRSANGLSLSGRVSRLAATMMGRRFDSVY